MNEVEVERTLHALRAYASALRIEAANKGPWAVPSWVEKFETLDKYMSERYGDNWEGRGLRF